MQQRPDWQLPATVWYCMAFTRITRGKLGYEIVESPKINSRVLVHRQVYSTGIRIDDIPAMVAPVKTG